MFQLPGYCAAWARPGPPGAFGARASQLVGADQGLQATAEWYRNQHH